MIELLSLIADAVPDGIPQLGATGTVGALVTWLMWRVSKLESRLARIEGAVCGEVGDTQHIQRTPRRSRSKLP